eukprot:gnl/TRDRNA2_/TRDRNA2_157629_c3_seq1.p1 gnl/TRDRNA2_/TRDRNA2_157629_c3~~gnl/TRDRNA2_/TRDRNA2_157629_c3_seq1.p1  ORF type:complete len:394 (-),score=100.46 gnl/TRDRNA2_/TRDRNA2_157629_c3_seq1:225-1325(-)
MEAAMATARRRHRQSVSKAAELLEVAGVEESSAGDQQDMVAQAVAEARRRHRRSIAHAVRQLENGGIEIVQPAPAAAASDVPEKEGNSTPSQAEPAATTLSVQERIQMAVATAYARHQGGAHAEVWYHDGTGTAAESWTSEQWTSQPGTWHQAQQWGDASDAAMSMQQSWQGHNSAASYSPAQGGCVLLGEQEDAWRQQCAAAQPTVTTGFATDQQQWNQCAAAQSTTAGFATDQQQWNQCAAAQSTTAGFATDHQQWNNGTFNNGTWNGESCQYGCDQQTSTYGNNDWGQSATMYVGDQQAAAYGDQWSGYNQQATYSNDGYGNWGMGDGSTAAWVPPVKDESTWGMQQQCYGQQQQGSWRYGAA